MSLEIAGLGNAIMDALVRLDDDEVLKELELIRGQMHPVDHQRWHKVYDRVHQLGVEVYSGGSCANSIATAGVLGAKVLYCGQVGDDRFGQLYTQSLLAACGQHALRVAPGRVTGKCLSLISRNDGERTMLTDLGTAVEIGELGNFGEQLQQAKVLHLTGYLFLGGAVKHTAYAAIQKAKEANIPISLDVADPFVASTIGGEIRELMKNHMHIGFFNRQEAEILTGKGAYAAVEELGSWVDVAVVKLGGEGSLVHSHGETFKIPVFPTQVLDTTGAGDAYAGAFLFGWARKLGLGSCGELGSRVAALTVGQVGAVCRNKAAMQAALEAVGGVR
jgi:sugar/nucleoside kinase (ribokinase family)